MMLANIPAGLLGNKVDRIEVLASDGHSQA
jgi:hypothetical protein